MQESKYGVISNVYERKDFYEKILLRMKEEEVSAIVLNGISNNQETTTYAIKTAAKTAVPVITIPCEESFFDYYAALGKARTTHKNIIDAVKNPYIKSNGHEILILPGTTNPFQSQFILSTQKETGLYLYNKKEARKKRGNADKILKRVSEEQKAKIFKDKNVARKIYGISNLETLAEQIKNPETTTIISPNPREFYHPEYAIDQEIVYETQDGEILTLREIVEEIVDAFTEPGLEIEQTITYEEIKDILGKEDIKAVYVNNGDEIIRNFTEKYGVTKTISSNPTSATHFAHTYYNVDIPENVLLTELHYNTGQAEDGNAGILYLNGDKAAYKNIVIKEKIFGNSPFYN